jgi:hypothetical protein
MHTSPYCGASLRAVVHRTMRAGRFARAALFAGAALAGCDRGKRPDEPGTNEPVRVPRVHGTVVDHQAGAPTVGANVTLSTATKSLTAKTDARGRYELEELEPNDYTLHVGYYAPTSRGDVEKRGYTAKQVKVTAGSDQRVDAKLEINEMHMSAPYGAPPARGRVV